MDAKAQRTSAKDKKVLSVKEKPKKRQAKPKTVKDPNQPKRPPTAYFIYLEGFRKTFKEMHPHIKGFTAVTRACGDEWKRMSEAEKAPYVAKAAEKRAEYNVAMTAYKKQLEGGVHSATPEESEKEKPELNEYDDDDDD